MSYVRKAIAVGGVRPVAKCLGLGHLAVLQVGRQQEPNKSLVNTGRGLGGLKFCASSHFLKASPTTIYTCLNSFDALRAQSADYTPSIPLPPLQEGLSHESQSKTWRKMVSTPQRG